jgi:hypothetical protein
MMNSIRIGGHSKSRHLPENWSEVRSGSLAFVVKTLLTYKPVAAKIMILKHLLKINTGTFNILENEQVNELVDLLGWMDMRGLVDPVFPVLKVGGVTYRMPKAEFDDGTAWQYAAADDYYRKYVEASIGQEPSKKSQGKSEKSQGEEHLDRLISVLLTDVRHKKALTDRDEVERRAGVFRKLKDYERVVILAYFSGIKQRIYDNYSSWLFTSEGSGGTGVNFGWWGRYLDIAKSGVFGTVDKVYETRFYDIIVFLIQEKEYYLAEKRAMEAGRSEK